MTTPSNAESRDQPGPPGTTSAEFYAGLANEAMHHRDQAPEPVPSLSDQLARGGLTGTFAYDPGTEANTQRSAENPDTNVEMSEADGLRQLQAFLRSFAETGQSGDEADIKLAATVADLAENLTYIGTPQLEHATATIAAGWKEYLDQNPSAGLYLWAQQYKSSQFILDRTLGNFSDDELEKYRGRLHFVQELRSYIPPGQERPQLSATDKVVMLDDWTATGRQLSDAYSMEVAILPTADGQNPNAEIQLIVAGDKTLAEGLKASGTEDGRVLPVKSVYQARPTIDGEPAITGLHSSTDDRFEVPIAEMATSLREKHGRAGTVMPPLTNIDRPYRDPHFETPNIDRMQQAYGVHGPSN